MIRTRCLWIRVSKDGVVPVGCVSKRRNQMSLVALSNESSGFAEPQWDFSGFERCFAFQLVYTEVGAHLGVMLAARMPLSTQAGLARSLVSAVVANAVSGCRDESDMMRILKESPVFLGGQSMSLWTNGLHHTFSYGNRYWLWMVRRRDHDSGVLAYWLTTVLMPLQPRRPDSRFPRRQPPRCRYHHISSQGTGWRSGNPR